MRAMGREDGAEEGLLDVLLRELRETAAGAFDLGPGLVTGTLCGLATLMVCMWGYLRARVGGGGGGPCGTEEGPPLRHADDFMQEWLEARGREREQLEHELETEPDRADEPSARRTKVIAECMESYGVGGEDMLRAEWPNNVISRQAVVYGSGAITRRGDAEAVARLSRVRVEPAELARCRRLAEECCAALGGAEVGMGSASSDQFQPFYVVASPSDPVPDAIDGALGARPAGF